MGDSLAEDGDIQNVQREAGGSVSVHTNDGLTADGEDKEREDVCLGQYGRHNRCGSRP